MDRKRRKLDDATMKQALLELVKALGSISKVCRILGCSRTTYYRTLKSVGTDLSRIQDRKFRRLSTITLEKKKEIEDLVIEISSRNPGKGKRTIAKIIQESGTFISPSGVYNILRKRGHGNSAASCDCSTQKKPGCQDSLLADLKRESEAKNPVQGLYQV